MKIRLTQFLLFCLIAFCGFGQAELPIGQWKSHLPYKSGIKVTQSQNSIIYSSERGLIVFNKEDLAVTFINKEDGLSESNVRDVVYDKLNEQLIIIYADNNIDILQGDEIINIPFIKSNTSIIGSKDINQFTLVDQNLGYIATDFGLLGFDTEELEFTFTTFTNQSVFSVKEFNDKIYIGTNEGLYSINKNDINLSDFGRWEKLTFDSSLPSNTDVLYLGVKYGNLYLTTEEKLFKSSDGIIFNLLFEKESSGDDFTFVSDDNKELMVGIQGINSKSCVLLFDDSDQKITIGTGCVSKVLGAVEDEFGRVWFGDLFDPIKYLERSSNVCNKIDINGPFALTASRFAFTKDATYIASQGITENLQPTNTRFGFYKYDQSGWTNFNQNNVDIIRDKDFASLQAITIDENSKDIYLGSYWNGVIKYNEISQENKHWNKNNSSLQGIVGDTARTRVSGLALDESNNLWVSNFGAIKPLAVKTPDDVWYSFTVPGATFLSDIIIDDSGNKWIIDEGVGNGILVYNEGSNIAEINDDRVRYINKNNSEIAGNRVNCLVKDLDGNIWVGTDQGPVVFDQRDPFDNSNRGSIQTVIVDGIPARLLASEDVLSIAIDGGNRKWFGTRNGLFVQSPTGKEAIEFFNAKNSPLLENKVTHLDYNPYTGEMFIVTESGIQSYKTETTIGTAINSTQAYAYPNPVRPNYSGPIAIKGLARDANVKITDINGRLVYETTALGGQAIWDGYDYSGNKAVTGVYLVFAATTTNLSSPDAIVTKILIVE